MIAHVAEAGEGSGRVVLHMNAELSAVALDAAVLLARSFRSEIEGLYTESRKLSDLAAFPFAREIALSGAIKGPFDRDVLERRQHRATAATLRRAQDVCSRAGVRLTSSIRAESPSLALANACAERGPWNMVALGEPFGQSDAARLRELFASVWGTTGFVVSGLNARQTSGPVIAVVEELDRFAPMLRTAETLAAVTVSSVGAVLVGSSPDQVAEMELQARLILGDETQRTLPIVTVHEGGAAAVGAALRGLEAGFVVAQFDGIAMPADGEHSLLGEDLAGPLLLVR